MQPVAKLLVLVLACLPCLSAAADERKPPAPHVHVGKLLDLVPAAPEGVVETAAVGPLDGKEAREAVVKVLGDAAAARGAQAYLERWYAAAPKGKEPPVRDSIYVRAIAFEKEAQARSAAEAVVKKALASGWNRPRTHLVGTVLVVSGETWRQPDSRSELAAAGWVADAVKQRVEAMRAGKQ